MTLHENEVVTCTFYNSLQEGSILAKKYQDSDGDGSQQGAEPYLNGWEIFIDSNSDGSWTTGEPKQTTAGTDGGLAKGEAAFTNVTAGDYQVCEVLDKSE